VARPTSTQPTDGELEILKVLWPSGPVPLGQVCAALRGLRPVATTTVATMLQVMRGKGLVKRTRGPRGFLWSAEVSQEAAASRLLGKVLDHVFDGSAQRLVAHLLDEGKLSARDRQEIRRLLETSDRRKPPDQGA
jgi:BlaI family transcriptional regulator, penicillinase repressor